MHVLSNRVTSVIAYLSLTLSAATLSTFAIADEWKVPKNSFGQPDLQGVWTNATMTTLERSKQYGNQLVLTEEMGRKMEENNPFERMKAMDNRPTDPNAPAPAAGSNVGGYNAFWMDPGTRLVRINGEYRTSIISTPKDGQIPYSKQGRETFVQSYAVRNSEIGFDGPEVRGLGERCLVGFGSTGGPPMLPVLYNNHYQIVQSPDAITILVEMNHDARIIRLNSEHGPAAMPKWLGDSVGHWDGNTLVVKTVNVHPGQSVRAATRHRIYIPPTATVTERFTRVGPNEIHYEFFVEDDEAYTEKWGGELNMVRAKERIFEYACHEGNYSLPGILAGGRRADREAAAAEEKKSKK